MNEQEERMSADVSGVCECERGKEAVWRAEWALASKSQPPLVHLKMYGSVRPRDVCSKEESSIKNAFLEYPSEDLGGIQVI
jgi:hypothetical protein